MVLTHTFAAHIFGPHEHTHHMLEKEFRYYKEHQAELVAKYNGKVVVIKGEAVIGVFADEVTAVVETNKKHTPGTYMVMPVSPGDEAYTATYHSRVAV